MSAIRLIKNPDPLTTSESKVSVTFERATFKSHLVMIQYCAESADEREAEYIMRNLLQTVAFLEKKHELKK